MVGLWSLIGVDGQNLGQFKGLVASDKNIVSTRIAYVPGRLPPLGMNICFLSLDFLISDSLKSFIF